MYLIMVLFFFIARRDIFVLTGRNCEKVKKPAHFPARSFFLRRKFDTQGLQIIVYQDLKITVLATSEYTVKQIVPNEVIRVEFQLGFRVSPRITMMFKKVIEEMVRNHEISVDSKYERLQRTIPVGDVQFVVMEKFLSSDNDLPFQERVIMNFYFWIKEKSLSEEKGFGLDQSNVVVEKFPLLISLVSSINLKRKRAAHEQKV